MTAHADRIAMWRLSRARDEQSVAETPVSTPGQRYKNRKRTALVVLGLVSCGAYGVYVPDDFLEQDPKSENTGPTVQSNPGFLVLRATDVEVLDQHPSIVGRDGGYSAVIDGRAVWLYGDTIFTTEPSGELAMVSNSWSWTDDLDASGGIRFSFPFTEAGAPAPFFSDTPVEREFNAAHDLADCREEPCGARWALWPQVIVPDASKSHALIFYGKVYAEPGLFNFVTVGQSIAILNEFNAAPDRHVSHPQDQEPVLMFREGEPGFGSAAVLEGDTLFVYGCSGDSGRSSAKPCRIGRVPFEQALHRAAWSYYAGDSWSPDIHAAAPVLDGNNVMSVGYNPYLSAYIAVYAKPLVNEVMVRSAPRPEGPWSDPVKAFDAEAPVDLWVYDALAHPEYQKAGGRIQYVTYSIVTSETTSEARLVEVELAKVETD